MDSTIGLLGGGQLGQMLCEAANPLGIKVIILDAPNSPAKQINARDAHIDGSFTDPEKIRELARQVDILTVEIEHVDTYVLEEIAEKGVRMEDGSVKKVEVQPSWKTLRVIQDKFLQKSHLIDAGVDTAVSRAVEVDGLQKIGEELGYPFMLKARRDAYDGRGNYPVKSAADIENAVEALKGRSLYAEKWADFKMEIAVMIVKTEDGVSKEGKNTFAYPAVETVHEDSVCKLVYSPPRNVSAKVQREAQDLARKAIGSFWGKGVFGVELFLMGDGRLVVNEIAPRPHNSGHYTIETCPTMSQYKAQLLSILGMMPSFPNSLIPAALPASIMLNILGGASNESHNELIRQAISISTAAVHMYGKDSKPGRKIGHVTIIGESMPRCENILSPLLSLVNAIRAERKGLPLPTATPSTSLTIARPRIAITMGSDSDLPVLKPGLEILKKFGVPYHVTITSAHRTPARMTAFAISAASNGLKVIIAAAGGAAHLPGMIAASSVLPIIGVPVKPTIGDGMDSLLSIVQMPRGVPVATVAINNSVNAALLALRILGIADPEIQERLLEYARDSEEEVTRKAERLEMMGFEGY